MNKKQKMAEFANEMYRIDVTGRSIHVTDYMKDYAIEKISKIERISDRIIDVHVIMDVQKLIHRCEIILKVNNVKIRAQADSTDMYASIDEAVKKMEAQLKKYLGKLRDHFSQAKEVQQMQIDVITPATEEDLIDLINEEIEQENEHALESIYRPHQVVKQKTKPLKSLTIDEAITKMDLSLDNFLVFRNEKTRGLQVIYRRDDGNYGVMTLDG